MPKARRGEKLHEFKDFSKGLNTEVETHLLDPGYLADVCNFDVDKPGVLRTRKGYRKLNEAQIAAYPIRGLHEIISNGKRYLVAFCGGHMFRFNDNLATWEEIYAVNERSTASTMGANLVPQGDFATDTWTHSNAGTHTAVTVTGGELKILSTAPTELLTNGGFESGITTGWTNHVDAGDYIGDGTGWARTGSHCLNMFNMHATEHTYSTSAYTTALSNVTDQVRLSWYSRGDGTAHIYLYSYNSSGTLLGQDDMEYAAPATYTKHTEAATQHATQNKYKVQLRTKNDVGNMLFDDLSLKARPRYSDSDTSPLFSVDHTLESTFAIDIKRNSSADYSHMNCYVDVEWYTAGNALISTSTYFTNPATTTASKTFTAAIPKGGIPATATQAKVKARMSGYFDGYDATAAGHGFAFDNVDLRQVGSTSTTERIERLNLDEGVQPSCTSFMGRIYISGYDKNIRLTDGVAVDYLPDIPTSAKYNCVHLNRIWLANLPEAPSRLYYSDLTAGGSADPDSVNILDCIDFDPADGDEYGITGIASVGDGIAVFKRHKTFHMTGSSYESWYVNQKSNEIGCASHRTICDSAGRLVFLADPLKGVFMFDGNNFTLLSGAITSRIRRIQHPEKAFAVMYDDKYYLFCDDQDSTKPYNDQVLVYSFINNSWTRYSGGIYGSCGLVSRKDGKFLIGDARINTTSMLDGVTTTETTNGGYAYSFLEGYHDDGQKIEAQFTTGDMPIRGMGRETRIRKVLTWAQSGSDTQGFTIDYASDRSSITTEVTGLELAALGINKWGAGEWQLPVSATPLMISDGTAAVKDSVNNLAATLTGTPTTATLLGVTAPVLSASAYTSMSFPTASLGITPGIRFTFIAAIKPTWAGNDGLFHLLCMTRETATPISLNGWELVKGVLGGTDWLYFVVWDSAGNTTWTAMAVDASNFAANTDHIVVADVDEDNNQRLFLDGIEATQHNYTPASPGGYGRESAVGTNFYTGIHDDGQFPIDGSILCAVYGAGGILSDGAIADISAMTDWTTLPNLVTPVVQDPALTAHWEKPQMIRYTLVPAADSANEFRLKFTTTDTETESKKMKPFSFYGFSILERERRIRA